MASKYKNHVHYAPKVSRVGKIASVDPTMLSVGPPVIYMAPLLSNLQIVETTTYNPNPHKELNAAACRQIFGLDQNTSN